MWPLDIWSVYKLPEEGEPSVNHVGPVLDKNFVFGVRWSWIGILTPHLPSCVMLGKLLYSLRLSLLI